LNLKNVSRFLAISCGLVACLILSSVSASASTLNLGTQSTAVDPNQFNSLGSNVAIPPNPGWASALPGSAWVSYGQTGDPNAPGYFSPANGTTVNFTENFVLSGPNLVGSITVMADDTTSVSLNGHLLMSAATMAGNTFAVCSDKPIGCLTITQALINLTPYLQDGTNTLSYGVQQDAGVSFGVDAAGSAGNAPEPTTFAIMGIGLAGLGLLGRRRFAKK
jgi:hypothetical protein